MRLQYLLQLGSKARYADRKSNDKIKTTAKRYCVCMKIYANQSNGPFENFMILRPMFHVKHFVTSNLWDSHIFRINKTRALIMPYEYHNLYSMILQIPMILLNDF